MKGEVLTDTPQLGESRGGEGRERSERADQGQAAQPLILNLIHVTQVANAAYSIEVEDQERTRKIFILEASEDGMSVVDTTPDVPWASTPNRGTTPLGGASG